MYNTFTVCSYICPVNSDGSYPKDEGSSQEVTQSLFVGESQNRGTNGGLNKYWGQGGADGKMRTLPRNKWVAPANGDKGRIHVLEATVLS